MPEYTDIARIPIPLWSEADQVPPDLKSMAEAIEPGLVLKASNIADRNARYGSVPTGTLVVSTSSPKAVWRKESSGWSTLWQDGESAQSLKVVRSDPDGNALGLHGHGGWATQAGFTNTGTVYGGHVRHLRLQAARTGAQIDFSAGAGSPGGDRAIMYISDAHPDWRPPYSITRACKYWTDSRATYGGFCTMQSDGEVVLLAGAPGTNIGSVDNQTLSLQIEFDWIS